MFKFATSKAVLLLIFSAVLSIAACKKDAPYEVVKPSVNIQNANGVYITNEGNFQFGNAKISYYDAAAAQVNEDIYQPANNIGLGDVCQSMTFFNNKAYIVVNNSGKIVVVNPTNFTATATINGFVSPRYLLPISNNKAYISDLYANKISVVNLSNNTISGTIPCTGWTEEMSLIYGKAYITNQKKDKLYVINTANDILEDSITVNYGANSIKQDKNGKLWVLSAGNTANNLKGALNCINPSNNQVEKTFLFANNDAPSRLCINSTNDTLYYLNNGVFRLPITATALPATAFVPQGNRNFYGIGVQPNSNNIYVADAIDYVQRGKIYVYNPDGTPKTNFLAGIIPNNFYFK